MKSLAFLNQPSPETPLLPFCVRLAALSDASTQGLGWQANRRASQTEANAVAHPRAAHARDGDMNDHAKCVHIHANCVSVCIVWRRPSLYVRNLPETVTETMMHAAFSQHPGFVAARLRTRRKGTTFAFVDFADTASAMAAFARFQGYKFSAQDPSGIGAHPTLCLPHLPITWRLTYAPCYAYSRW